MSGSILIGVALLTGAPTRNAPSEPRPREPFSLGAPGVRLTAPPGWTRPRIPASIPGFGSVPHVMLVEELSKVRLAAAVLPPASPTLLPAALLERLESRPPTPDRVRLGGRLPAYFYRDLSVPGLPGRLAVFAVPTTVGIATVACLGVTYSLEECAQVADSLRLTAGEALRLDADAAFQLRLGPQIRAVDAARERGRRQLSTARSPREQAEAATSISKAYGDAATALAPLVGRSSSLAAIVAQLRANAATYDRIAAHLRAQDRVSLARDREVALTGETRLKALLSRSD
jgi:hypothetical protein